VDSVPVAVTYAASHPERVSHLILCDGWTKFSDYDKSPAYQLEAELRDKDWVLFTETFAQVLWGFENPSFARQFAEYMRVCTEPDAWRASQAALEGYDISALLPLVTAPTLVIHNRSNRWQPLQSGQRIAAGIADARLVVIDDLTYAPLPELIEEFVGQGRAAELPEGMAVILFADIAESTALTEQLGDAAFRSKARELDTSLRSVIRDSGGTPVEGKLLGDGVLAVFTSARQAIEAALSCGRSGDEAGLALHLGVHAGDVIREGNNVYGGAVNIAARIADASAPGEILASDTVRGLARTSAGVAFEDRGERELKGVGEPVRMWAVTASVG
jgi:class 3 adenylate cyclase